MKTRATLLSASGHPVVTDQLDGIDSEGFSSEMTDPSGSAVLRVAVKEIKDRT